jgi:hypothetical protein
VTGNGPVIGLAAGVEVLAHGAARYSAGAEDRDGPAVNVHQGA